MDTLIAAANRGQGRSDGARPLDATGRSADEKVRRRVLDRYLLLERLGSGGFGEVWRAEDTLLRREVAVKQIPCGEAEGVAARAAREAHAAARLSHPAIVALYEAVEQDGSFYLTSELVQGATLAKLISQDALCDQEIFEIGLALCDALIHAHGRGVIHRDVKPQNILVPDEPLDSAGVAKLTDFGGARLAGEDVLTRTGDVLGTLAYMAPEQSEGHEAGPEADLYALALVLYEALCGENPVRAGTPAATARRIGTDLPSLRRSRGDLPPQLTAAIDRALQPRPEDRGALRELADALRVALCRSPQTQRVPANQTLAAAPRRTGSRLRAPRPPRIAWLTAVIAVLAWQWALGRPGLALLLAAGALPLLLAIPTQGSLAWLSPALAPLLGLAGMATAFPALAGQAASVRLRGSLGALGYWWLCLAEVGLRRGMAPGIAFATGFHAPDPGGHPLSAWAPAGFQASLSAGAHALSPLLSIATLCGAMLWAVGAIALPWVVRGTNVGFDMLLAGTWSAALLAGPQLLASSLQSDVAVAAAPAVAVLAAVLAALLAVALAQGGRAAMPPRA